MLLDLGSNKLFGLVGDLISTAAEDLADYLTPLFFGDATQGNTAIDASGFTSDSNISTLSSSGGSETEPSSK